MTNVIETDTERTAWQPAVVVEEAAALVAGHYVFPEVGDRVAALLRDRLASGAYDVAGPEELAERVTADLLAATDDRHLRLLYHEEPVPPGRGEAVTATLRRRFEASLGGVPRVELLGDGVVVLELSPALFDLEWSAPVLSAALTLAAGADALLVDLRANRGGHPETVAFVCGYLLDERTHLNTMHARQDPLPEQFWSPSHVPGRRFGGSKPLYVLTSSTTFSGAEELAYDLQQLGRATVVGEVTGGGAHPRDGWTVHDHLEVAVPVARAVNPVSGTNWEGTGVRPDVLCPAAEALDRAYRLARERLAASPVEATALPDTADPAAPLAPSIADAAVATPAAT
jgi:Peptidase family S41/N-terminal domain of Peptidase_S41 in eukaryotic IRBP